MTCVQSLVYIYTHVLKAILFPLYMHVLKAILFPLYVHVLKAILFPVLQLSVIIQN
jgi:hypothetical protein